MKRLLRSIAPFLGAILLLQGALAPLHCLAMARTGGGFEAVICSPEGMRVIHVDDEGRAAPADGAATCFVCADAVRAVLPEPLRLAGPSDIAVASAWQPMATPGLLPPARAPPYAPRGPPLHA